MLLNLDANSSCARTERKSETDQFRYEIAKGFSLRIHI